CAGAHCGVFDQIAHAKGTKISHEVLRLTKRVAPGPFSCDRLERPTIHAIQNLGPIARIRRVNANCQRNLGTRSNDTAWTRSVGSPIPKGHAVMFESHSSPPFILRRRGSTRAL